MKAIILLQSIIIVLGAYYIYTMSHAVSVEPSPVPVVDMVPTTSPTDVHEGYVAPTKQPPTDVAATATVKTTVTGGNDAGMEYPINPDYNYPDQPLR